MKFPKKAQQKLALRAQHQAQRSLPTANNLVDFASNDYLGFAKAETIFDKTHAFLVENKLKINGATGSRLLTGNHTLYKKTETYLANFHNSQSALLFNSGYDANIGFFSSVPQRGDVILYDELIHASIRDGVQLSNAKAFKFKHNDLEDLTKQLLRHAELVSASHHIYVVTESVFSMDGDSPNLKKMASICQEHQAFFVVDEAHALGVFGKGLVQQNNIEDKVFARIITFGKALGCHGAVILGSQQLKDYLVNFARSFIYTTGLSPHAVATILIAYQELERLVTERSRSDIKNDPIQKLNENVEHFLSEAKKMNIPFIKSTSSIHCCIIGGNERTKNSATQLQEKGFDVKPILSPTVQEGKERLRFCLHSYNSTQEITNVLKLLVTFV